MGLRKGLGAGDSLSGMARVTVLLLTPDSHIVLV